MDLGVQPEELGAQLAKALSETPTTTVPVVSLTMADVSTRLAALEDAVADLRKKVEPAAVPKAVELSDILPSDASVAKGGSLRGKRTKRSNRTKKRRSK